MERLTNTLLPAFPNFEIISADELKDELRVGKNTGYGNGASIR